MRNEGFVLQMCAMCALVLGCASGADVDDEYKARFDKMSATFRQQGARVDPMDPDYPYTMRVYLPASVSMDMTERQANEMAGMARERLHDKAIVYINTESGQTIGKATPWGFGP